MSRGAPLGRNKLLDERLIEWYFEEKLQDVTKTMLLVAAIRGADDLSKYVRAYHQSILPTEKANEEFLKENFDRISSEFEKSYKVGKVHLPGEEY